jgi:hypothetical protein
MRWGNWFVTFATNVLYGSRLHDMETCYKVIDREVMLALDLEGSGFEIEPEITAKLLRMGVKIVETPIYYEARTDGKKLTPMDGLPTLLMLFKCLRWTQASEPGRNLPALTRTFKPRVTHGELRRTG